MKVRESVNMPVAGILYAPNAASEYQAFRDKVNDAFLQVSPTESKIPHG